MPGTCCRRSAIRFRPLCVWSTIEGCEPARWDTRPGGLPQLFAGSVLQALRIRRPAERDAAYSMTMDPSHTTHGRMSLCFVHGLALRRPSRRHWGAAALRSLQILHDLHKQRDRHELNTMAFLVRVVPHCALALDDTAATPTATPAATQASHSTPECTRPRHCCCHCLCATRVVRCRHRAADCMLCQGMATPSL